MKGGFNIKKFTYISIPFTSTSPIKGAYICLCGLAPPSHLTLTFTSSMDEKTSKKYEFPEFRGYHWYFLPIDLPDVELCEISGKGRIYEGFLVESVVFFREDFPQEIIAREANKKLWSEAQVVEPKFIDGSYDDEPDSDGYRSYDCGLCPSYDSTCSISPS
ncbi:hypothetical protein ADUPG1_006548 [Aduncisulcus paluster]|uniref:Uncharacterized protein n=1 Tax=Aduncisulcus paluster TaxID=2918883 RepID=A0ABQ5KIM7_9EUKA|nr:hypothetical protein ADUPG1_006548 [Aduncisulcus paluster]